MPSNHLILCHPLLLPPSIFPSIRGFSNESALCIRQPKYWSFSISPSNEYSGLISFRMACLDLLSVQGTLKSLLQHHSSKASILWLPAFFIVQFSCPYMTTGKTIALTRQTFLSEVMALVSAVLFLRGEGGWWLLMDSCAWGGWIQGMGEVKEGRSSPWAWEGPFPTPGNTLRWNLISVAHESSICLSNQSPWVVIVDQYLRKMSGS